MASKASDPVVTPVGRMVMGSLYKPRTQDANGQPLMYKSGAKAGQPRADFFFALAIPKGQEINSGYGEKSWMVTPWGQAIYAAGVGFLAHAAQLPAFAWKVQDGDSLVPNSKGNALANREGCKGHWVLFFSGTIAPRICNADGTSPLTEPDAVKPGYFIQVAFTAKGNDQAQKPGVYLNPLAVARAAFGEEIHTGIDTTAVGFGQGVQLPPGASAMPLAQMPTPAAPQQLPPALPTAAQIGGVGLPPVPALPQALPPAVQPQPMQPPPGVVPNAAFLQPAAAPVAIPQNGPPLGLAMQPAQAVAPRWNPAAPHSYEQYRQAGYSDDALRGMGFLQ